jgi:hypothetical protein
MLRMIIGAALAMILFAGVGLAGDKGKGKGKKGANVSGTFESYKDGTLTIQTKGKKGAAGEKKEFKVADNTPVTVRKGQDKTETNAVTGFKDVAVGTRVTITADEAGKVTAVQVGAKAKKKNK